MKPYYEDGSVTIYHGDCRETLPSLGHFDLLLTDPPYGIGEHGGSCRTRSRPGYAKHAKLSSWDDSRPDADVMSLVLDSADSAIIWGGNYFADMLPPSKGWLYWRKLMGGDFADGELAWTSINRALREFTKCPKGMDKQHPCEKPLSLMKWCIDFAGEATSIVDPFAGTGTVGRAAKDLGIPATLVEREERYCEIAAERCSQEVLDLAA